MNPKIIIGDLHLKLDTKEFLNLLYSQIKIAKKDLGQNVELIILGDIYDGKAIIRSEIQNYFSDFLANIVSDFVKIYLLVGNHDLENLQKKENSIKILENISDKICVIDNPFWVSNDKCLFLPYLNDNTEFANLLNDKYKEAKYVFCHQGFNGFSYRPGLICNDGVDPRCLNFKPVILSGHFHAPQDNPGSITYVGSAWSQSFNEANEDKRFFVLTEDGKIEKHKINGVPKHLVLKVLLEESKIQIPWDKMNDGDKVHLQIEGKKEEISGFSLSKIEMKKKVDIQVYLNITDEKVAVKIDENLSPLEMFFKYVEQNKKTYEDVDIEILKKNGERYIKNHASL